MDIVWLLVTGGGLLFAWQSGLLDQAGQAIVDATKPKAGFAKHRRHGKEVLIPVTVPIVTQPRMRLTVT